MLRIGIWLACLCVMMFTHANVIDYNGCQSIQDAIAIESQEITRTHFADHDQLSQLYVSRGESYLFDAQYEKAIEDFDAASYHIGYSQNNNDLMATAFRASLGKVVSCDNLGLHEHTEQAFQQLQEIANHVGCNDCLEHMSHEDMSLSANILHFQDMPSPCRHKKDKENRQQQQGSSDNYNDIVGPDLAPPNWCEEVITGVGRSMDAIACLAPNKAVKIVLIGIIEGLISRGLKCCQTGDFWKACAAPISRKWQQWDNYKKNRMFPNDGNLPLFID